MFHFQIKAVMQKMSPILACMLIAQPLIAEAAGDVARGSQLYQARCAACHSLDYNGVGPMHRGVFGRMAGSVKGYAYSPALAQSGIKWDEKSLDRWLSSPEKFVPGQRMGVSVEDAQDRSDLIAHLKAQTAPPTAGGR